jgi:glycosyltransferase involved in cell wall biosynthesis
VKVAVIIPAHNEEGSIGLVLRDIPDREEKQLVVVDNASTDRTAELAQAAGATLVREDQKGYGNACLAGMAYLQDDAPDVVVFLDADYSDYPGEMISQLNKIAEGHDLVIGSRVLGNAEPGALLPQARWGNRLAVTLIRVFFGYTYTDLGPFRAIRWQSLMALQMQDRNFGWTVEMQVKAAKQKMKVTEVPVSYRKRIGRSKVTGTLAGTLKAGFKILYVIFRSLWQ